MNLFSRIKVILNKNKALFRNVNLRVNIFLDFNNSVYNSSTIVAL